MGAGEETFGNMVKILIEKTQIWEYGVGIDRKNQIWEYGENIDRKEKENPNWEYDYIYLDKKKEKLTIKHTTKFHND